MPDRWFTSLLFLMGLGCNPTRTTHELTGAAKHTPCGYASGTAIVETREDHTYGFSTFDFAEVLDANTAGRAAYQDFLVNSPPFLVQVYEAIDLYQWIAERNKGVFDKMRFNKATAEVLDKKLADSRWRENVAADLNMEANYELSYEDGTTLDQLDLTVRGVLGMIAETLAVRDVNKKSAAVNLVHDFVRADYPDTEQPPNIIGFVSLKPMLGAHVAFHDPSQLRFGDVQNSIDIVLDLARFVSLDWTETVYPGYAYFSSRRGYLYRPLYQSSGGVYHLKRADTLRPVTIEVIGGGQTSNEENKRAENPGASELDSAIQRAMNARLLSQSYGFLVPQAAGVVVSPKFARVYNSQRRSYFYHPLGMMVHLYSERAPFSLNDILGYVYPYAMDQTQWAEAVASAVADISIWLGLAQKFSNDEWLLWSAFTQGQMLGYETKLGFMRRRIDPSDYTWGGVKDLEDEYLIANFKPRPEVVFVSNNARVTKVADYYVKVHERLALKGIIKKIDSAAVAAAFQAGLDLGGKGHSFKADPHSGIQYVRP